MAQWKERLQVEGPSMVAATVAPRGTFYPPRNELPEGVRPPPSGSVMFHGGEVEVTGQSSEVYRNTVWRCERDRGGDVRKRKSVVERIPLWMWEKIAGPTMACLAEREAGARELASLLCSDSEGQRLWLYDCSDLVGGEIRFSGAQLRNLGIRWVFHQALEQSGLRGGGVFHYPVVAGKADGDPEVQEVGVFFHGAFGEVMYLIESLLSSARGTQVGSVQVLWNTPWYADHAHGSRSLE